MAAGSNEGGQLNLLIFEVGMITRDPLGIVPDIVSTIGIHPLVVVPASIVYSDTSRTSIVETHDGSIVTKGGRGLRTVQLAGSFGVISRGLLLYVGTGDLRFKRFYHDVVRLGSAVSKAQVDAEKDPFRSPLLSLLLLPYDPERSSFFVNFYDFWHNEKFECEVQDWRHEKRARGGASASGMTAYQMTLKECGPIVTGALGTALLNALFEALTTWDSINELIKSYTLDAIVGSFADAGGILVSQFTDSMNAFQAQIDGATAIMNGGQLPDTTQRVNSSSAFGDDGTPTTAAEQDRIEARDFAYGDGSESGLSPFLASARALRRTGAELLVRMRSSARAQTVDDEGGAVDWSALDGEGGILALDQADQQDQLAAVIDAAAFQEATGALYGMSREEFAAYLAATGRSGREPALAGTIEHVVTELDTIASLTRRYGIAWDLILRVNDLMPDEALLVGTKLLIPRERALGQPNAIAGLPVFGSHAGQAALGADFYADFRVDTNGQLQILSGPDLLIQGHDWVVRQIGGELLELVNQTPPVIRETMVRQRLGSILASDKRISSVDRITTTFGDDGSMSIVTDLTAINGLPITTAQAAR